MVKFKLKHKMEKKLKDKRGTLQKIINGNFSSCIEIYSKKGSIRSNHYHKKDSHYIYVIKGEILWAYKNVSRKTKLKIKKIKRGELIYTPAMQEHFAYFVKDSHIMAFSPKLRTSISYEKDLVRLDMLKYKELKKAISNSK